MDKPTTILVNVQDSENQLNQELIVYNTDMLTRMKQEKGVILKNAFATSMDRFNHSLENELKLLIESVSRLDEQISEQELLRNFSRQYIDDIHNTYHVAVDSMHHIFIKRAEHLQHVFEEELLDCEIRYNDRVRSFDTMRKAVLDNDMMTDMRVQTSSVEAIDTVRNEASMRLSSLSFPQRVSRVQASVMELQKEQEEDILERRKRLNHLKIHTPHEESDVGVLKSRTVKYAQELSLLKSSQSSDAAIRVIEILKAEKKYILESLKGVKAKINREQEFYKGKLIHLAHNYKTASTELTETRDRLDSIRRLYTLCDKLSASMAVTQNEATRIRDNDETSKFDAFDEHSATLLTQAVSLECQISQMNDETNTMKEGLKDHLAKLTIDKVKLYSWFAHYGLLSELCAPESSR